MIIIGITGTIGAGKGVLVDYLKKNFGFTHYSARDFIVREIEKRGLDVNRDTMREVSNDLRSMHHSAYIIESLYNEAAKSGGNSIIESIRTVGEIQMLSEKPLFHLFAVDADLKLRYERIKERKSVTDSISFEKFVEDEKNEMTSDNPATQNLTACIGLSEYTFTNNGTLEEFHHQVDNVMKNLLSNSVLHT